MSFSTVYESIFKVNSPSPMEEFMNQSQDSSRPLMAQESSSIGFPLLATFILVTTTTLIQSNLSVVATLRKRMWQCMHSMQEKSASLRQKLSQQGWNTMLLLLLMSNLCAVVFLSFAWYGFSMQRHASPLYEDQWKPFLAVYTGIMAMDNFLKPVRLGLALSLAPQSDHVMMYIQHKTGSKTSAIGFSVACIGVITLSVLVGGVMLASTLSGVPAFQPSDISCEG